MRQRIEVEDGEEVSTVLHPSNSDRWMFFCHGFGSDKTGSYVSRCERLSDEGWNAVRFDFRGNGDSDGEFIEQSLSSKIEDLKAVIDFYSPGSCVVFGSSFGGKVAFHLAAEDGRVEAVIERAPVTYNKIMDKYRKVVENKGEFTHHEGATIDERFYRDLDTYSFDEVFEKLDVPVLIFHGSDDSTVHIENSFEAAKELEVDVSLEKLAGEKHSFSDRAESYMLSGMVSWLDNNGF